MAKWDFYGWNPTKLSKSTAAATTTSSTVTVSELLMASGFSSGSNYFSDNSLTGASLTATTLAESITNNEYFEFTIEPTLGKSLSVASIDLCAMS